jgi:hypothetical protein
LALSHFLKVPLINDTGGAGKELRMKKNEIVSAKRNEVSCYSDDEMNNKIISGYVYVTEQLSNNEVLQDQLAYKIVEKKIIGETEYNFDMSRINLYDELQQFFKSPKLSDTTKNNYRKWINNYLFWCETKGIDGRKITRMEAENYLFYLDGKYSPNSTREMILSVSSFYSFLWIRHSEVMKSNPFYKLQLPKVKFTRRIDTVSIEEIKLLINEFKRIGRKDIVCAVELMEKYGFRVGIFENMKIDDKGNYRSVSKETVKTGRFTPKELKQIKDSGVLKVRTCTIRNIVREYTKKLYDEGKIDSNFSCHDIRSYRITEDFSHAKNAIEMKIVSEKYHKNISTSMRYVRVKPAGMR